jgi:hypothetical protein
MGGLSQAQAMERLTPNPAAGPDIFQVGTPGPGGTTSPNLSVNPYLSPYMGMFSGSGDSARPLFAMPPLSSAQQRWMGGQAAAAFQSVNRGNLPLPVASRYQVPPPPPPTTTPGPGGGPTLGPGGVPGSYEPGINGVPVFVPIGSYLNPTTMVVTPFGGGGPNPDTGGGGE